MTIGRNVFFLQIIYLAAWRIFSYMGTSCRVKCTKEVVYQGKKSIHMSRGLKLSFLSIFTMFLDPCSRKERVYLRNSLLSSVKMYVELWKILPYYRNMIICTHWGLRRVLWVCLNASSCFCIYLTTAGRHELLILIDLMI